jgi:hypothetical protein
MNNNDPFNMDMNIIGENFKAVAKRVWIANIASIIVFFGGIAGLICLIAYLVKHYCTGICLS